MKVQKKRLYNGKTISPSGGLTERIRESSPDGIQSLLRLTYSSKVFSPPLPETLLSKLVKMLLLRLPLLRSQMERSKLLLLKKSQLLSPVLRMMTRVSERLMIPSRTRLPYGEK
jgi:hypothetical protein